MFESLISKKLNLNQCLNNLRIFWLIQIFYHIIYVVPINFRGKVSLTTKDKSFYDIDFKNIGYLIRIFVMVYQFQSLVKAVYPSKFINNLYRIGSFNIRHANILPVESFYFLAAVIRNGGKFIIVPWSI